jgi:hypothetical protein
MEVDSEEQCSDSTVPVTRTVTTKTLRFIKAEPADMDFMNGFCDGNTLTASREHQH